MGGKNCSTTSKEVLQHMCRTSIPDPDNTLKIRVVGGAMHSILFPEYISCDVDIHFVPTNVDIYKPLIDVLQNQEDPFANDNASINDIQHKLEENAQSYTKILAEMLQSSRFIRDLAARAGNDMVKHEMTLAHAFFTRMKSFDVGFQNGFKHGEDVQYVPQVFTLDAFDLFMKSDFPGFARLCLKKVPDDVLYSFKHIFDSLAAEPNEYVKWFRYCVWCNDLYHNGVKDIQGSHMYLLPSSKRHILSATLENRYQSIELNERFMHLVFIASDARSSLLLSLLVFKTNPRPHFDVIIDAGLYTPLHASDPYTHERIRMYYGNDVKTSNSKALDLDTSQAYARELIMRSIPLCKKTHDDKFQRMFSRINDLEGVKVEGAADTPEKCQAFLKNAYTNIKNLARIEQRLSQTSKSVCTS
jgi:hypothetical protein